MLADRECTLAHSFWRPVHEVAPELAEQVIRARQYGRIESCQLLPT